VTHEQSILVNRLFARSVLVQGQLANLPLVIIVSRHRMQQNGQPMKFISICDRTGIVECEIFAAADRLYGLNTVRYPVVQILADVKAFDNFQGFTLEVRNVAKARVYTGPRCWD